jgi:hypothetical protein
MIAPDNEAFDINFEAQFTKAMSGSRHEEETAEAMSLLRQEFANMEGSIAFSPVGDSEATEEEIALNIGLYGPQSKCWRVMSRNYGQDMFATTFLPAVLIELKKVLASIFNIDSRLFLQFLRFMSDRMTK